MAEEIWTTILVFAQDLPDYAEGRFPPQVDRLSEEYILLTTEAFNRGKQAFSVESITGPHYPKGIPTSGKLALSAYYSLGLSTAQKNAQGSAIAAKEEKISKGNKEEEIQINKPDTYSGGRLEFRTFATQLQLAFLATPAKFAEDKAKIVFAASFLRGPAYT